MAKASHPTYPLAIPPTLSNHTTIHTSSSSESSVSTRPSSVSFTMAGWLALGCLCVGVGVEGWACEWWRVGRFLAYEWWAGCLEKQGGLSATGASYP